MLQPIQRTLIVTSGVLAQRTGEAVQIRLQERPGPRNAAAVVSLTDTGANAIHAAAAEFHAALARISLPALGMRLVEQGYALDDAQEISLILLLDAVPDNARHGTVWVEEITSLTRHYLGVAVASLLIWLTMEPMGEVADDCLVVSQASHHLFPRGILAVGPVNEMGLRLPDEPALVTSCAEAVWLLVISTAGAALEWLAGQTSTALLGSLGISWWFWDKAVTVELLQQRWLAEVISQWLAPAPQAPAATAPEHWLQEAGATGEPFRQYLATGPAAPEPDFDSFNWQMPWPWQLPQLFTRQLELETQDQAAHPERQAASDLHLEGFLQTTRSLLQDQLRMLLDEKVVGGLAFVNQWVTLLVQKLHQLRCERQKEEESQNQVDHGLLRVRSELEAERQTLLAGWPATRLLTWVGIFLRPWRWLRVAWHYWQLRSLGQQLAHLYQHQARRRREHTIWLTTLHAYLELEQMSRHCLGQVDEMADMLAYLEREIGDYRLAAQGDGLQEMIVTLLYPTLTGAAAEEAATAAAAVGGLGQQLTELDDKALLVSLEACAAERMAPLRDVAAATLLPVIHTTPERFAQWWQGFWEQATPLWRYDPARLPERVRTQETTQACLWGQNVNLLADVMPDLLAPNIHLLETRDPEHLVLIRFRGGLMPAPPNPSSAAESADDEVAAE